MTQNGYSWVFFFFLFQTMYGTMCCYWQHQAGIAMYMLFAGLWGGSLSVKHFLIQAYFLLLMSPLPCLLFAAPWCSTHCL